MIYNILYNDKEFQIHMDKIVLLKEAHKLYSAYEPETYVTYGTSPEWGDPYLDADAYKTNVDNFAAEIQSISEHSLQNIVNNMPKKKNGKLAKNRIYEICSCGNTKVIHEWHNTWIYQQVFAKADDENTITICMRSYTDTPG